MKARLAFADWDTKDSPSLISLFSGAGGMDLGFFRAGFKIKWAVDTSLNACNTYSYNLGLVPLTRRIEVVKSFPSSDGVIACTPCQGYSMIGKRNLEDQRNWLYKHVIRCLKETKPKFFVSENVRGLKMLYGRKFLRLMLAGYRQAGYRVKCKILNARDYGVPQNRERIFIVGIRKDLGFKYEFPQKTHGPGLKPYVTIRETIGNMPPAKAGEYYVGDWPFFYMSRNRLADWDDVSYTIGASARHIPLHPSSPPMRHVGKDKWEFTADKSRYRRLSLHECARLQTFPDSYKFFGGLRGKYRLIGNAVPPRMAEVIAISIREQFSKRGIWPLQTVPNS